MPTVVVSDFSGATSSSDSTSECNTPCKKPRVNVRKNSLIEKRSKRLRKSSANSAITTKIPQTKSTLKFKVFVPPALPAIKRTAINKLLEHSNKTVKTSAIETTKTSSPTYILRKSLSETQMEYKGGNSRKSGLRPPTYQTSGCKSSSSLSSVSSGHNLRCNSSRTCVHTQRNEELLNPAVSRSVPANNDLFYSCINYIGEDNCTSDPRFTGLKVFSTIMLNAWRRRRAEVKRLNEEIKGLRAGNLKIKNQIHVLNSMLKIEKKHHFELSTRFQYMSDDNAKLHNQYEKLNNMLIDQKAFSKIYECQLSAKDKEFEGINMVLDETKTNLFKSMQQNREIESKLTHAHRKIQELENSKNDLLNQIFKINAQKFQIQDEMKAVLAEKDDELDAANSTIYLLEQRLLDLKMKDEQVIEFKNRNDNQQDYISDLRAENENLKNELKRSIGNRMMNLMHRTIIPSAERTLKFVHLITYYLLPATPPPKAIQLKFSAFNAFYKRPNSSSR